MIEGRTEKPYFMGSNNASMASRDIAYFKPKPKLLKALELAVCDNVISITTIEREKCQIN